MELLPPSAAAVNDATLKAGAFDQDARHGGRRSREEMALVVPSSGIRTKESHLRFMHERRRIQRVARGFSNHVRCGQLAQFVANERQQPLGGCGFAPLNPFQDFGHVTHGEGIIPYGRGTRDGGTCGIAVASPPR
jgi:hypothetical protein